MKSFLRQNIKVHSDLDRLFREHQVALLGLNIARARKKLAEYESDLLAHMRYEEKELLPLYKKHGEVPNAPTVFFTGEHKRMREFLRRIKSRVRRLLRKKSREKVVELFDLEAAYKTLVQHHDRREISMLYPALDRFSKLSKVG